MGMAPLDYGPVLLRRPFGSRLAADTLPSGCPCRQSATVGASPWLYPPFPTSCPYRVLHGCAPQPTRHYPRLWIHRPSFGRPRDLNPPDQNAAQYTLWSAQTPCRPFRRASLPSRGDTTLAPGLLPAAEAHGRGLRGVDGPVPEPELSVGTAGPPRFLGNPCVPMPCSWTPVGPRTPGPCGASTWPPL